MDDTSHLGSKVVVFSMIILFRSNKKNIQDALFLLYSNIKNFFKQKKIRNVPEIPQMAVQGSALRNLEKDHFTWVL